jgi:deazaflavin-dependent oxidoreductase (nitroreductase family)
MMLRGAKSTQSSVRLWRHTPAGKGTRMAITDHRPGALLRLGLRLPTWLFRLHLGRLLGERFLLLEHKGRKTGKTRRNVLEVVLHDKTSDTFYVVSGWGKKADWYRNIHEHPLATVGVGGRTFEARAEDVPPDKATDIMQTYTRRYPLAFKELTQFFMSEDLQPGREASRHVVEEMPMVAFHPNS